MALVDRITQEINAYLKQIHELYLPQKLLQFSTCHDRHQAYRSAIQRALSCSSRVNTLHTGIGSILSAMTAASCGAQHVTICEPRHYLAAIYRTILDQNGLSHHVSVIRKQIVELKTVPDLSGPDNLLVLDCIDAGLLGNGIAATTNHAIMHQLVPGNRFIPARAVVSAAPVELRTTDVNGFDLSAFNRYRWSACHDQIQLSGKSQPLLANPLACFSFDFSRVLAPATHILNFEITDPGLVNAIVFWFDLQLDDEVTISSAPRTEPSTSWQQAFHYLGEEIRVDTGDVLAVVVRHDCRQISFEIDQTESGPGKRGYLNPAVPQWHFPMIADQARNDAYRRSIQKALKKRKKARVIDIGTGTGLLAMMAAQSGAESVTACEMIPHLAETADKVIEANGYGGCIDVIAKLSLQLGVPDDMEQRADILVSETVDHSLLGERFLEALIHARQELLAEHPVIIPAKATVFAMGIELRIKQIQRFNFETLNLLRLHHYSSYDLTDTNYQPLTDVFEAFAFNFYDRDFKPAQKTFEVPVINNGICNAVVFWFQLHLDEEIIIGTDPESGTTAWQQAVVFFDSELRVVRGGRLPILGQFQLDRLTFGVDYLAALMNGHTFHSVDLPQWYPQMVEAESGIHHQTEAITRLIRQCPAGIAEQAVQGVLKKQVGSEYDPILITDFLKHLGY